MTEVEKIVARLKKRRKELNLTQQEVGDKIGVSSEQVSNWERGFNKPPSVHLFAWAKALKYDIKLTEDLE
jgi:transcriptional regulator with XRE-family HTH domain